MKDAPSPSRPLTAKRQQILAKAFEQLIASRAKIDPMILKKIRQIVGSNPLLMKKLGLSEAPKGDQSMPLSAKKPVTQEYKPPELKKTSAPAPKKDDEYEQIDQAKNMEIMAKLMEINPKSREGIKAMIEKAGK